MDFGITEGHQMSKIYNLADLIDCMVDITQFPNDYEYDIAADQVYVNPNSPMCVWLTLKGLTGIKCVHKIQGKHW